LPEKAAVHTENGTTRKATPIVIVSVPDWGSKDLETGTLRGIVKDLGFEWDEFTTA